MCFIGGCLVLNGATARIGILEEIIKKLIRISGRRGTDGAGFAKIGKHYLIERELTGPQALAERFILEPDVHLVLINSRLEPTNEYIADPQISDLQPYTFRGLTVVHNGIISNDKKLC